MLLGGDFGSGGAFEPYPWLARADQVHVLEKVTRRVGLAIAHLDFHLFCLALSTVITFEIFADYFKVEFHLN